MTGGYATYSCLSTRMEKLCRDNKMIATSKKDRGMDSIRASLQLMFARAPGLVETMDATILAEEYAFLRHGRKVLFPASADILARLSEAEYSIEHGESLFTPGETLAIALPRQCQVAGLDACGVLVNISDFSTRAETIVYPFFDWLDLQRPRVVAETHECPVLAITYQQPTTDNATVYYRAVISTNRIAGLLNEPDPAKYREMLGNLPGTESMSAQATLTDEDARYQRDLLRIVCGLLIYQKALPDSLTPGFPEGRKIPLGTPATPKLEPFTLHYASGTHESPGEHYRRWHFRQLRHEKYYRGAYAKLRPGERVVFVRDAVVGSE